MKMGMMPKAQTGIFEVVVGLWVIEERAEGGVGEGGLRRDVHPRGLN